MSSEKHWVEDLPVTLTQDEFVERSTELAEALRERDRLEEEFTETKKSWKERIDAKSGEIKRLTEIVRDRAEPRPVECSRMKNLQTKMMESIRQDNGEIFRSRPLNQSEIEEQDMFEKPSESDGETA